MNLPINERLYTKHELKQNERLAVKAGYELITESKGTKYWRHPDGGEANFLPDLLSGTKCSE